METLLSLVGGKFSQTFAMLSGKQRKAAQCLWASIFLVLMASSWCPAGEVQAASPLLDERQACTRQASRWSCILGCFKCAETYGRKVYDMASCCAACQATKAVLIDDGPDVCSMQFFTGTEKIMNTYNSVKRHQYEQFGQY